MQKLYCYVDESGQDTVGRFFVVSVVIVEKDREHLMQVLESIEKNSGKRNIKWHSARPQYRKQYVIDIAHSAVFQDKIFFDTFSNTKQYIKMTAFTTARAILRRAHDPYTTSIFVDGFSKREIDKFEKGLRELDIKKRKIRGVRREENDVLIRLADAMCGLIRDAEENQTWAKQMMGTLAKKGILSAL